MQTVEKRHTEPMPPPKDYVRKLVSLPPKLAERLVDFRFRRRQASETAAIRLLLERALDADEREEREAAKPTTTPKRGRG